jgi:RimJ/RimL family protein N-acetyltransferase
MANQPFDLASAERRPGAGTDRVLTAPMSKAPLPTSLRTARLLLRPWMPADAPPLQPILEANQAHLGPWIPAHVSAPVPLSELAARLAGFADDFAAGRGFRFAMLTRDGSRLLGEADLFPRTAEGRVPLAEADRVELGYWLDAGVTGQGFATEATRALLDLAATLPGVTQAEIRCEAANAPSAAVPRRLGFTLADTILAPSVVPGDPPVALQIWTSPLDRGPSPD